MTVLVLADEHDLTADRVVSELLGRQVPVFRCDLGRFPTGMEIDFTLTGMSWDGALRTPQRTVRLSELRSVWYRHPTAFQFPEGLSGPERQHVGWEAKFGLGGVLASLPVLWVNHPARHADACYKPWQLAVAARCGLVVPVTCVTNDADAVRRHAGICGSGGMVVKTLGSSAIAEAGGVKIVHTHRLSEAELADLSGIEATAHLVQAWVDKSCEVRVTAVGQALFAAQITATSTAAHTDWRADMDALSYQPVPVPDAAAEGIARFMREFGLSYGAFDFVVPPEGPWVFLECNPGGQYGWIEGHTGLPITVALADLLARGAQP